MPKANKIFFLLLFLSFAFIQAQNLVANPSFEQYSVCPSTQGQASLAIGWIGSGDTPDYFNSCATFTDFSVPYNWGGYQPAASGNAYCAIGTYLTKTLTSNIREYIGTQLSSTLNIGTKYYISFKANLSLSNSLQVNCATDKIGALFSKQQLIFQDPIIINHLPQVKYNNLITDTLNWTQVFGSFIADSNYKYITIGNFYNDNSTDTLIMNGWSTCSAYYYIDDVCVSTDSLYTKHYQYVGIKSIDDENSLSVYPNPATDFLNIINNSNNNFSLKILNYLGETIIDHSIDILQNKKINIEKYSSGIYYLLFKNENEIITKKIIKQ